MDNSKLTKLLRQKNPNLEEVLLCDEILTFYRMSVGNIVQYFKQKSTIQRMYQLMRRSQNFQVVRKISSLHISPNTTILHEVLVDQDLFTDLLKTLDKPNEVHRYVLGAVASIIQKMFENWPKDTFSLFNRTVDNYIRLIKNSHIPGIYHLLSRIVTDPEIQSNAGEPFVWMLYMVIMDEHGPGWRVPYYVQQCACYNSSVVKLDSLQRCQVLSLLNLYFNDNIDDKSEIFNAVTNGIPLMLQDAADDRERAFVFKLGLTLNPNEALGLSALSIINCFKSNDLLLQFAVMYITAFEVNVGFRSLELFLYRLLAKEKQNNFVVLATAKLILSLVDETKDQPFMRNIKQIIGHLCSKKKTVANRAFRTILMISAEGYETDFETDNDDDMVQDVDLMFDRIVIDQKFINQLQTKATSIENNQTFVPLYSLKELVKKDDISKMEKLFKTLNKLDVKLHKEQMSQVNKVSIYDARNKKIDESSEVELDDDFLLSPPKQQISKSSSLPIKNNKTSLPPSNSGRRDSNPQLYKDDDIIELEEIDVTDTLPPYLVDAEVPFQQEMQRSGPLTIQESLKEPIPLVEVSKNCKPAPKNFFLSPLSPRTQLRRNSQNSYDSDSGAFSPAKRRGSNPFSDKDSRNRKGEKSPRKRNSKQINERKFKEQFEIASDSEDAKDSIEIHEAKHKQIKINTENKPQNRQRKFTIENVLSNLFIDREKEKKKPTLNRKVLIVEVFERTTKLKLCQLDTFEFYSSMPKSLSADSRRESEKKNREQHSEKETQESQTKHRRRRSQSKPADSNTKV